MNSVVEKDIKEIINKVPYKNIENKVFLITGANGFLASNMVNVLMYLNKYYLVEKCTVIALCRNRKKAESVFHEFLQNRNFKFCIQGVDEKINIYSKVDYIIHTASSAVTNDFGIVPADVISANVIGTYNLLQFAREIGIDSFLFFSSGAAYGEIPDGYSDIKESDYYPLDFLAMKNCYAEGKRAGEALCRAYWLQYNIPTKIVRISHTYGPGIDLDDGRVFSDFVKKICKRENLVIRGTGTDVRPFCYITDAVIAFFIILFQGQNGEVYNMANRSETVTIRELAERLIYQAFPERNLRVEGKNLVQNVSDRKVEINIDKLMALGWKPQVDIIEGFKRTVQSFEEEMQYGRLV